MKVFARMYPRVPPRAKSGGEAGAYFQDEAAAAEILIANIRLVFASLAPLILLARAVVVPDVASSLVVPGLVVWVAFFAYALGVRLQLARNYWRPIGYVTVLVDVATIAIQEDLYSTLSGEYGLGTKAVTNFAYFLIVAVAGLRYSVRLAMFAGTAAAVAYTSQLLPAVVFAPNLLIATTNDLATPQVSVVRVLIGALLLFGSGIVVALFALGARRVVSRALDTFTFMFADLREFTAFIEQHGDAAGAELVGAFRSIVRAALLRFGGGEIRTEGDSFYLVFTSARQAIDCAIAIQYSTAVNNASSPDRPLHVGIGLHAGEPETLSEGYVGSAVNLAARLGQRAEGGQILVSELVRGLVRTSGLAAMREVTGVALKGIDDPPRVYEVLWQSRKSVPSNQI